MRFIRLRMNLLKRWWVKYRHTENHDLEPVKGYSTSNKQLCRCKDCGYNGFVDKELL